MGVAEIGLAAVMDMDDFDEGSKRYMETTAEMGDQTESTADRLSSALGTAGLAVTALAGIILAVGVGALVAFGSAALDAGLQFDEAFDSIVIKTGATGQELEGLKDDFKEVFLSVPTDAGTAETAISVLNQRLELTGETLQGVAVPLLEVTRLTGGSIKGNSEALAGVAQDWSIANEDLALTLDKVFVATQETGADFGGLLNQMDNFGPILKSMGFGFEDSIALLSGLEEAGVNTGSAMMGLRMATKKLADSGKPINEAFADVVTSIKGATTETEALSIASEVFGSRAGIELTNAIRSGKFELEDLSKIIQGAGGDIMDTSEATMDFGERITMMKNKVSLALQPIGEGMMDVLGTMVGGLMPGVEKLANTFTATLVPIFKEMIPLIGNFIAKVLTKLVAWLSDAIPRAVRTASQIWTTTLLPAFQAISTFWTSTLEPVLAQIWDWLQVKLAQAMTFVSQHSEEFKGALIALGVVLAGATIIGAITSIVGMFGMLLNPIGLVIAAIGLLGAAWAGNWGGIRGTLTAVWTNALQPALAELWRWLQEVIPPAIAALADFWNNVLLPALNAVWEFIKQNVLPILADVAQWLMEKVGVAVQNIAWAWKNVWHPAILMVWEFIKNNILPIIAEVVKWLAENIPVAIQAASDYWNNVLKPALDAVWSFIQTYLIPIFNTVVDILKIGMKLALEVLAGIWENVLLPALNKVWDFLKTSVLPILQDVRNFIVNEIGPKVLWFKEKVIDPLAVVLANALKNALKWVYDKLVLLKDLFSSIKIPDWLVSHSPPPLAVGLEAIALEIENVEKNWISLMRRISSSNLPGAMAISQSMVNGMLLPSSASSTRPYSNYGARFLGPPQPVTSITNSRAMTLNMPTTINSPLDVGTMTAVVKRELRRTLGG